MTKEEKEAYAKGWNDHDADARANEHHEVRAMASLHAARWWNATCAERLRDMADYAALKARLAGTTSAGTVAETFEHAARIVDERSRR